MTRFLNGAGLMPGDTILFSKNEDDYMITYKRKSGFETETDDGIVKITLSDTWRIIEL